MMVKLRQTLPFWLFVAMSGMATNVSAQCNYDDASQHGGWGWNPEKSESCPPVEGQCEDRGGYPWGWNPVTQKSCSLIKSDSSLVPETNPFNAYSAPVLSFSQNQSATLLTGTWIHYYRLELSEAMALQLNGDIHGELDAAIGGVYKGQHSYSLKHGEPARCFSAGTHILAVANATGATNETDKAYNINVTATDQNCVEHTAEVVNNEHPDGDWYVKWAVASDGTVFSIPLFGNGITAFDQNGDRLWSKGEIYPTSDPDRLSNGSTAVLSGRSLQLIDTRGEFLWTIELDETDFSREFTNLVGNDDTIIVYNNDEVASFNGYDGSLRWRYSPRDHVSYVKVADNGNVLVLGSNDPNVGFYYLEK